MKNLLTKFFSLGVEFKSNFAEYPGVTQWQIGEEEI